jgi:AraC-like DNA-binding protein
MPALYAQFCAMNALLSSTAGGPAAALLAFLHACASAGRAACPRRRAVPRSCRPSQALQAQPLASLAHLAQPGHEPLSIDPRLPRRHRHDAACLSAEPGRQPRDGLQAGGALADIACELGFADQSHLQRVFKAHAGITPGRYRR